MRVDGLMGTSLPTVAGAEDRRRRAINQMSPISWSAGPKLLAVDVTSEVLDCAKMGKVGSTHAGKRALHY